MNAYNKSINQLERELCSNSTRGLAEQEALLRLSKNGPNSLPEGSRDSWLFIFIRQFQNPLIYVLLIAATLIFFVGNQKMDAFIISGILLFNAFIGTIQEGRTRNIIASLKQFIQAKSVVVRDGKHRIIDERNLVVGDVIVLKEGERVPADARIIQQEHLEVDEAILTGESSPIYKQSEPLSAEHEIVDQKNMVFKGTYISSGSGLAFVVATGKQTQIGMLQRSIEEINTDIPLKKELNRLSYVIIFIIFTLCCSLFLIGLFSGRPVAELVTMLTALFICVIPEGLPVVLTLVLVTGAYRMAKKQVLIKNLQGVEALGRTDVIVIDKTGTLTRNEMMVTRVVTSDAVFSVSGEGYIQKGSVLKDHALITKDAYPDLAQMANASALLNSSTISFNSQLQQFEIKGDPTEVALGIFASKLGISKELCEKKYKKLYEIPFSSKRKLHAGFYSYNGKGIAYIIGAPETLFLKADICQELCKVECEALLHEGLRTVAIAMQNFTIPAGFMTELERQNYYELLLEAPVKLLGMCGIQDSIRSDVAAVIDQARSVGLRVIMATGDHKDTALYVAKKVGIYKKGDEVLEGKDLKTMSDEELSSRLLKVTVCARVSPEDKVRIIKMLHEHNNIVAMTGDGVNDVPSLLAADLGIAMGGIGVEVTKQASDLVLLNDSFTSIISAIEQGRHIFYTLRRVVLYFFATNLGEIFIVLVALMSSLPLPLTAAQILWLNFITDGFLDVGLSMEPQEDDLLAARWLHSKRQLIDWNMILKSIYFAIPMGLASLLMFAQCYTVPDSLAYARTMTLICMAMFQWFNAWNCRSESKSLFTIGIVSNRWLILATGFVLLLQFLVVYVPFLRFIFQTVPLTGYDWLLIFAISFPIVLIEELRKYIVRFFEKRAS